MTTTTWFIGLAFVAYLMVALIAGSGRVLAAVSGTSEVAGVAARAAATAVDPSTRQLIEPRAVEQAKAILAAENLSGTVQVSPTTVTVTATDTIDLPLLQILGINQRTITSTRTAQLLEGVGTP